MVPVTHPIPRPHWLILIQEVKWSGEDSFRSPVSMYGNDQLQEDRSTLPGVILGFYSFGGRNIQDGQRS